jgi:hypothetical protein
MFSHRVYPEQNSRSFWPDAANLMFIIATFSAVNASKGVFLGTASSTFTFGYI